jgi:parallel beta-helix repeat protein
MRTPFLSLALVLVMLCPLAPAQSRLPPTDIPAGPVSGIWTRVGSPYHISGEITIPNDSTLLIEPGVEVVFLGHYKLNVQGRLLALGTEQDTIRFTAADTQTGWHGVRFTDTPNTNDTSRIIYCSFKYGKANTGSNLDRCGGAILISQFDKVLVSDCLFDSNMNYGVAVPQAGPAIYVYYASPAITNSTFSNNKGSLGTAIACIGTSHSIISHNVLYKNSGAAGSIAAFGSGSSPLISGNIIFSNSGGYGAGINAESGSTPRIENNIIHHNQAPWGPGIFCWSNAKPVIINNTIVNNIASSRGGGIFIAEVSNPILINNVLYGNSALTGHQVWIDDNLSDPSFLNCDIQGGISGFAGSGAGSNYAGIYEHNIDQDPLFKNTSLGDYSLSDSSFCIGAGVDSIEVAGVWHKAPPFCFSGNMRPTPIGTIPDIGACENLRGTPFVGVVAEGVMPAKYLLHQNYPNPFNPSTTIKYELPQSAMVKLSVYDMLGREVYVLVNERREAGVHEVKFDGSSLASGVYFYRLQAGDFTQTKRLLLLR